MRKKTAYFIGIAGKAMASLAKAMKDIGWEVVGSDKEKIYPPMSLYLKDNKIKYLNGYKEENLNFKPDLLVVGRSALLSISPNPECQKALSLNIPVLSYPEVIEKYLIKKNSIVVAGTWGKSTVTSLITWILINANLNPSFMIGGVPLNFKDGVKITDSEYSVVEGDETPALRETDPPKFFFYHPKFLLLTAVDFDHPEIYSSKNEYKAVFKKLVQTLPPDGTLVYNQDFVDQEIFKKTKALKVSFSLKNKNADYFLENYEIKKGFQELKISGKKQIALKTLLFGHAARENTLGAVAMCLELGINPKIIKDGVATFKGLKTHLEYLGNVSGREIYWDIGQQPEKVRGALEALKEKYPRQKIIVVFDPSATALKYKNNAIKFKNTFEGIDEVIIRKVKFLSNVPKNERVLGSDFVSLISSSNVKASYVPQDEKILEKVVRDSSPGNIIVFFSSGGLEFIQLIQKTKEALEDAN